MNYYIRLVILFSLFAGIVRYSVTIDDNGFVDLHQTCAGVGLGGNPYRDGSFEYYAGTPQRTNDMKGYGPFLRAAIELEQGRDRMPDKRSQ